MLAPLMLYIHARARRLILRKWHVFASFLLAPLARLRCLGVMQCRARAGMLLALASFQLARRALEVAQCRPVRRHC